MGVTLEQLTESRTFLNRRRTAGRRRTCCRSRSTCSVCRRRTHRPWSTGGAPGARPCSRQKSLGGPLLLRGIDWQVRIRLAHDGNAREAVPSAVFTFAADEDRPSTDQARLTDTFAVRFTPDELADFYNKIERIQGQVDALR